MNRSWFGCVTAILLCVSAAGANLSGGMAAFQERRWNEAIEQFIDALKVDPHNPQAHTFMNLAAHELQTQKQNETQEDRLELLAQASKRYDNAHLDPKPFDTAILATTQAQQRRRDERWDALCDQADAEMQIGHLLAANDLIFQILSENGSHPRAQRYLSELQSRLKLALDSRPTAPAEERYAWAGFYAFGQSEFLEAMNAWSKADVMIRQTYNDAIGAQHRKALRYEPYLIRAETWVDARHRKSQLDQLFQRGSEQFDQRRFQEALESFRRVAVADPEYPQIGKSLARCEAAVENERLARIGEKKQAEFNRLVESGQAALAQSSFAEARAFFSQALEIDPSNAQAQGYLSMVESEIRRRNDPKAAQQHYEAGLVAYAGGRLDEAVREWKIARRMNPQLEKAANALAKVRKEKAFTDALP